MTPTPDITLLPTPGSNRNPSGNSNAASQSVQKPTLPSAGGFQNLGSFTPTVVTTTTPSPVALLTPNVGLTVALPPAVDQNEPSSVPTQQLNSFFSTPEEKAKKIKQAQAMQALISVTIFCDRDTSGRFDDWIAHLEAALALGDFDESRKLQLMRSKLYGEAAEEFDTFKLDNPIRARSYTEVRSRLMKLFHSMETRSQRSVEFHNMSREPEENMRRYANRMRKAFHLAYPLKGTLDPSTNASREQMMMDRFIEGLQSDLQARLKHKEFPSFEKLIDKAELLAMALEEAQTRSRIHAVFAAREGTTSQPELARVMEALERLNEKVERKATTHHEELQNSLAQMKKQLSQQVRFTPQQGFSQQPGAFKRTSVFCDFHNTWGSHTENECHVKMMMANDRCHLCRNLGHRATYCPTIKNPKPPPPSGMASSNTRVPSGSHLSPGGS